MECAKLHSILREGRIFDFESREKFREYLRNIPNFTVNGVYFMFEKDEIGHDGMRIVRVGINKKRILVERLNTHINGNIENSIFRKHLFNILGSEEKVTDHIAKNIRFCVISDPENRREEIEKKSIAEISKCADCKPSNSWLGLKSQNIKISSSGLWNVHHVYGKEKLTDNDLEYIKNNIFK